MYLIETLHVCGFETGSYIWPQLALNLRQFSCLSLSGGLTGVCCMSCSSGDSVSSLDNSTRWTPQVSKLKQTDALKVTTPYMVMVAVRLNHLTPQEVGTAPISPNSFEKVPYMPKATKPVSAGCETDRNFHSRALGWWLPGGGLERGV